MFERILLMFVVALVLTASKAHALTVPTVTVGNPGNAADIQYHADPLDTGPNVGGRGAVAYTYEIGKNQVTYTEYAEFLNAVAADDTHSLYSSSMGGFTRGGITRSGSPGSYSYTVKTNMANKPVVYVNFWKAARFTNWLHNGQPTGAQDNSTTEDGAYTLGGVTNPDNLSVHRNVGSQWFIPDENEWYKAAYHQPASQGGDVDDYWMFPTASNVQPIAATATAVGDIANPGANVANYMKIANWNGTTTGNITTVGSAGPLSDSYYGTTDQGGNVWDWYETIVYTSVNLINVDGRGIWGSSWDTNPSNFRADHRVHHRLATVGFSVQGFRVARYADPALYSADFDLDNDVDSNDLTDPRLGWSARYGIDLGGSDFLEWQRQFGSGVGLSESMAVPEPTTLMLALAVLMMVRGRPGSKLVGRN